MVDDSELAPVLSGTHLPTSEGWKAELAQQREEVGRSVGMSSTGNRTWVAHMQQTVQLYQIQKTTAQDRHTEGTADLPLLRTLLAI